MSEGQVARTYKEALRSPDHDKYKTAVDAEVAMQWRKGCYKWVRRRDVPKGARIHHGMWVFRIKHNADGCIAGLKARWVFIGSQQKRGADYDETFAPTGRPATMRMCHAISSSENFIGMHADCEGAFLNSYVSDDDVSDREIYMEQIEGVDDPDHPCLNGSCS